MLPLVGVHLGIGGPLAPLFAVPFPHLLTKLIHGVEVGVVDELHEVPVPDLLAWGHAVRSFLDLGGISLLLFMKQLFKVLRVDDLQGHLEEGLHEAVLHSVAEVNARVLPLQAPQQ